ncbi:MAG: MarC family protein [Rubrimonas sp.]|uniref:MarC family protein n=1 Tax=Rubrimonas sp. TaxID=2036015 RepID=UPI002FDED998
MDLAALIRDFITLFVVIDPIGSVPIFIHATRSAPADRHRAIAVRAVLVAGGVLMFFLVAGQLLLEGIGISLASFRIAGGIVLFLFALSMIFGDSKPETELAEADADDSMDKAVFPLAMPSIASPGAMLAVVALTDNDRFSVAQQAVTAGLLVGVLAITLAVLFAAVPLNRRLGSSGASVISRVMGIILAAVAVDAVLRALVDIGAPLSLG